MLFSLLSALGSLSITIILLVLYELSRRLARVLRIRSYFRLYFVAAFLTFFSSMVRFLSIGFSEEQFETNHADNYLGLAFILPLCIGVCIGLAVTWRYWGWLVYASDGKTLR